MNLEEMLVILNAVKAGKTIQMRYDITEEWTDLDVSATNDMREFYHPEYHYRVKPHQYMAKSVYLLRYTDSSQLVGYWTFPTEQEARRGAGEMYLSQDEVDVIEFTEVLEDD